MSQLRNAEIVSVRRRQVRSKETRQKILEAATAEFASAGFDGVTTRSIAARADVQHGLVIYHFESKLGVWRAVVESTVQDYQDSFMKRLKELEEEGADVVTKLRELQRHFIWKVATQPELHWLMSHEVGEESKRVKWLVERYAGPVIDVGIDLIAKAQKLGRFVEGNPAHLHYLFVGAATRVFLLTAEIKRTLGEEPFEAAFVNRHVDLVARLFFREPVTARGKRRKIR